MNVAQNTAPTASILPVTAVAIIKPAPPMAIRIVPNTHQPDLPMSCSLLTCDERLGRRNTADSAKLIILVMTKASEPSVVFSISVTALTHKPTINTNR